MRSLLRLGLVVMASSPEAETQALPEPLQQVASCSLPRPFGEVEAKTAKFVEVEGQRAVSFREATDSWGTTGIVTWKEWLVLPGTCRRMALYLECSQGAPDCSARLLHLPEQPPTDTERRVLRSWMGGDRLDPRRPDHQSALVTVLPERLPAPPEIPSDSITARAVRHAPRKWMQGPLVPQARSWSESDTREKPHALDNGPEGFVTSGHVYSLHRGDLYVRPVEVETPDEPQTPDEARTGGSSRLRLYSSQGRWTTQRIYVALEQPAHNRSAWLYTTSSGHRLLGTHQGRAWLEQPVFMDPGFSLKVVDPQTGAMWSLALNASSTFEPDEYRASAVTPQGLLLEIPEDPEKTLLIPWPPLERALREAKPLRARR